MMETGITLLLVFAVGFGAGYAAREQVSRQRLRRFAVERRLFS